MDFDPSAFAAINAFGGVDFAPHNKGITPIFFVEAVLDEGASEREGRTVYVDKERVRIHIVGDSTAATHPVDAGIIARFRDQYDAWKRKESGAHIKGMPLSKWPMATPAMVRELESLHIYSVEDLAAVSDGNVQNLTNGRAWRDRAAAWLRSSEEGPAAAMKYAAQAQRLREEVAELKKMLAELVGGKHGADKVTGAKEREFLDQKPARRRTTKAKKKSAWTPERRAKQAEILKARMAARKAAVEQVIA
jgi:hypothetical protein